MVTNLRRYTVINEYGEFLEEEDRELLLPTWTKDLRRTWVTTEEVEARRMAEKADGIACEVTVVPINDQGVRAPRRGLPPTVQQQVRTLSQQGMSYRQIARLLNISKSTVGNIINRS